MKIIVIAKAHSQRLPQKHVVDLLGRPLIHWAIRDIVAVLDVPVVIATDSEELNTVALAGVPPDQRHRAVCLLRPPRLSEPRCSGWEPFFWAIDATQKDFPGPALLVQGSVPVRPQPEIDKRICRRCRFESGGVERRIDRAGRMAAKKGQLALWLPC